jgi:hypothetical protein
MRQSPPGNSRPGPQQDKFSTHASLPPLPSPGGRFFSNFCFLFRKRASPLPAAQIDGPPRRFFIFFETLDILRS